MGDLAADTQLTASGDGTFARVPHPDWSNRGSLDPIYENWLRFNSVPVFNDAWLEAARLLVLVDLGGWPAASRSHVQEEYIAPTIDVSCEFHRLASQPGWYLLRGVAPFAGDGLVASQQHVWDDCGHLLASGISHLLCRPLRERKILSSRRLKSAE